MGGIVLLSLLGWGLVYTLVFEDDDDPVAANADDTESGPDATATNGDDILDGVNGDDRMFGNGGDDLITGAGGDDELFGGAGQDIVFGEDGDDFIRGGADDDLLVGGEGEDTLRGDAGDDVIQSVDILDEDAFLESAIDAETEDDVVVNFDFDADENEADTVFAGVGDDIVLFGGNDVVSGGAGEDILTGGDWIGAGQAATITDFEQGTDVLVYSYAADAEEPVVTFGEGEDTDDAEILINGQAAIILQGVDFAALTLADVMLEQRTI
jgi:Ca2+-binding RTX toxin-like protein